MMGKNTIAHYEILRKIGRGGMAEVYEAVDKRTKQKIALKVLLPHLASDTTIRKRFLREAKVGIELDHPGIVKVYDVEETEDQIYIAMEFVKGKTLAYVVQNEKPDISRIIDIAIDVSKALSSAHDKKIIHRDLKPKNIMIHENRVKVMDFGLARIMETSSLTDRFEILGTLYYMSPQQVTGDELDQRTDIFSLGSVLYEMLTSAPPFSGKHPGTILHAILYSDPLRISETGRKIPIELEQVVFKALRKMPSQRYQTARDLASDLRRVRARIRGQKVELIATEEVFEETPHGIYAEFAGRESEMRILEDYVNKMMKGESSTIIISGEVGIGKSRLVWELGKKVKTMQARYLVGRCLQHEASFPYKPVIDILRGYFTIKDIHTADSINAFIDEKVPHLKERSDIINALLVITGEDLALTNKEQLWDTISEMIKIIAQDRPLLIHIEDLQWADQATLNLLTFLARSTTQEKVLIIGTYRPEELAVSSAGCIHPLQQTLEILNKFRISKEISLGRLDLDSTRKITNSVFPDSEFPEDLHKIIHSETEGNPLFIVELLKLYRDTGFVYREGDKWIVRGKLEEIRIPNRINEVITNRLQRLSDDEKQLMNAAAVEGEIFHADTLTHCLRVSRIKVLRYLQNLEHKHHLVHATETKFTFDHGKIREVIYDSLIADIKKEYHALIADYYSEFYMNQDEQAANIARHLLKAGKDKEALHYYERAAQHAKFLSANEDATANLNSALNIVKNLYDIRPTGTLVMRKLALLKSRAETNLRTDRYNDSLSDYEEALDIARGLNNKMETADCLVGIGTCRVRKGDHKGGLEYYSKAITIQREIGDRNGEGQTLRNTAIAYWESGEMELALNSCNNAMQIAEETRDEMLRAGCLMWLGGIYHILGEYEKSLGYCRNALSILKNGPDRNTEGECLHAISIDHHFLANYNESLEFADQTIEICRRIGNRFYEGWGYLDRAMNYRELGRYDEALSQVTKAQVIFEHINAPWGRSRTLMIESWVHADMGNHPATIEVAYKCVSLGKQSDDKIAEAYANTMAIQAHTRLGDWNGAMELLERTREIVSKYGPRELKWKFHNHLIKLWLTVGNIKKAHKSLESLEPFSSNPITRTLDMDCHIDQSLVAIADSSYDLACRLLRKALHTARKIKHARGINRCLLLMAETKYGKGNLPQAMNFAQKAATMAEDIGRNDEIAKAHLLLARIYSDEGKTKRAIIHAEKAKTAASKYGMKPLLWKVHWLLGSTQLQCDQHATALAEYNAANVILDEITSDLIEDLSSTFLKKKEVTEFYADLKALRMKSKDEE